LVSAGAMPVTMPMTSDDELIADYLDLCDGLTIPGGQDVDPALWGDGDPYDEALLCHERDQLELALIRAFLAAHKPIFATCRGMQILNVALGGSLCMDVPSREPRPGTKLWRHHSVLVDPAHPVEVAEGSLLSRCVEGRRLLQVNSSHHCCVDRLGEGLVLVGEATDGIPEAIELPSERFCLGVQWHPEVTWPTIATDAALWRSFVDACRSK
jgi:putative glutamine amidotransferase